MATVSVLNSDVQLSASQLIDADDAQTITGVKTFDIDPSAPFAVTSGSAVVTNLDADKLDGQEGASYLRSDAADTKDTGDLTLNDSIALTLGTGGDVDLEYNAVDTILALQVAGTGHLRLIGNTSPQLVLTTVETDATNKEGVLAVKHFTNSEEPMGLIRGLVRTGDSFCDIGGGVATINAPENIRFFTATDHVTTSGVQRMRIDSLGNVAIGVDPLANAQLTIENGKLALKETTTPSADADYGKIYTKSDNKLYFQDGAGVEHEVAFV